MNHRTLALLVVALATAAHADCPWTGTWAKRITAKEVGLWMTIEPSGPGCKLTYTLKDKAMKETVIATIETRFDGSDSPTVSNGKPTKQTTAVKQVDAHHWTSVVKYEGKQTATGKSELSADGKVFTTHFDITVASPNGPVGKQVEVWDKR